jgi:hypothetical protein
MSSHAFFHKIDQVWLGTKIVAAQLIAFAFALTAVCAFGVFAVEAGVQGLRWLETGSWASKKTIAEAFPISSQLVGSLKRLGIQGVDTWALSHSVVWLYASLAILAFLICGLFVEVADHLRARRQPYHPGPVQVAVMTDLEELGMNGDRCTQQELEVLPPTRTVSPPLGRSVRDIARRGRSYTSS